MRLNVKNLIAVLAVVMLSSSAAHAIDVGSYYEKNNVKYYVTGSNTCVVAGSSSGYSSGITIPATVKLGGILGIGATECTVTGVKDDAFKYTSVTSIDMSAATNLRTLGTYAFAFNSTITSITLPSNSTSLYTSLPEGLFYDATALTTITNLPTNITSIGYSCFRGTAITSITVPASVTTMASYVFADNTKLSRVNFNSHMTEIPAGTFRGCSALRPVMLTLYRVNGVSPITSVGESAFWGANSMSTLPEGLTQVTYWGDRCFYANSALQEITLNADVTYVGYDAFNQCTALKKVHSNINNPDEVFNNDLRLGRGMFYLANTDECRLYVPVGSEKAYHEGIAADITHLIACGTLAEVLNKAEEPGGDYQYHYLFTEDLLTAATPYDTKNMKPYLMLKDNNESINKSEANGREAYPEEGQQVAENYDQSNWIAVSVNWSTPFQQKYVKANTMTITLNSKVNPNGAFASGFNTDDSYEEITSASTTGSTTAYTPNEFWPANFIEQPDYFLVQPKPMEYALIKKAIYHNGAFFMTTADDPMNRAANPHALQGSVALDSTLVTDYKFKEGCMYDMYAIAAIDYRKSQNAIGTREFNPSGDVAISGWAITPTQILRERDGVGDVNLDGEITVADVTAVYNIILGISEEYKDTADVNFDGQYTVADVTIIYNIILNGKK